MKDQSKEIVGSGRSENAFVKQIFDRETGRPLHCRLFTEPVEHRTFSTNHFAADRIEYDDVMRQVVEALRQESRRALQVLERVSSEEGILEKERQHKLLSEQAREIFTEMSQIEQENIPFYRRMERGEISETEYEAHRAEISQRLAEKEVLFTALMERVDGLDRAFSGENPWILLYAHMEVPEVLSKAEVRRYIDRVLVDHLETVEVIFPESYIHWRSYFPDAWQQKLPTQV